MLLSCLYLCSLNMHDMQTKAKPKFFDATLVKCEGSESALTDSLH